MVAPLLVGLGTFGFNALGAFGDYQQGNAQTDAVNQARTNEYRDKLKLRQYTFTKELGVYEQRKADLAAGLKESERALDKSFTQLYRRSDERMGAAARAGEDALIENIRAQGKIAALQAGLDRGRALAMVKGEGGRRAERARYDLMRARFGDIQTAESFVDQANSLRNRLFRQMPMAPTMGPMPSAPVMQQGPSALSLIAGLGSAAMSGLSAGLAAKQAGLGGGGGKELTEKTSGGLFDNMPDFSKGYGNFDPGANAGFFNKDLDLSSIFS